MKNPTFAKFMDEIESIILNLSKDELKSVIMNFAETQSSSARNDFLRLLKQGLPPDSLTGDLETEIENSPDEFLEQIKTFNQRILDGEFYDEEESSRAYDREEGRYWRRDYDDYYGDETDFTNEEYVLEAVDFLDQAKMFYRKNEVETAQKAYEMLFNIFENREYYDGAEYFIYGFSFQDVIDAEFMKEHKTIYLRCIYLSFIEQNDFDAIYSAIVDKRQILLSDIIEIDRNPLPMINQFTDGFINYLKPNAQNDEFLIDALFLKGGMEEIKNFAYNDGKDHPPVFLYYYQYIKEENFDQSDILQLVLDGIKIIPKEYQSRAILSCDLIEIAKQANDKELLTLGYSTAFYSQPTLKNLAYFLDFIISEKNDNEIDKLLKYLATKKITILDSSSFSYYNSGSDIYSLDSFEIERGTVIVGRYILEGIEPLVGLINPNSYLGFSGRLKYIAMITALALKSISQSINASAINALLGHYLFDPSSEEYATLKKLVSDKAASLPSPQKYLLKTLEKIEKLAVNRVSYILNNKRRGGYDSACLLLVACAEAKQLLTKDGNELIHQIDTEYKRFTAFRRPLKSLTAKSELLAAVG